MDTRAGAWRRPTTTSTLPWGRAPSTQIPPSWEPSESSSLQSLVSGFCWDLRATAEDVVVWLQSMKSIWLDSSRYCRWSEPLGWSERSFLLDPKGGYICQSLFLHSFTFPFPGNTAGHCWHLCHLHVLWSSGGVAKIFASTHVPFHFRLALSLQTKPAGWRRSTCSSTIKATWTNRGYVTQLGIRVTRVHHFNFLNGLIALLRQTNNGMFTRLSLRWYWLSLKKICDHQHLQQKGEGNDGSNLTAYVGVYDNWDTEKKGSKCIPLKVPR